MDLAGLTRKCLLILARGYCHITDTVIVTAAIFVAAAAAAAVAVAIAAAVAVAVAEVVLVAHVLPVLQLYYLYHW